MNFLNTLDIDGISEHTQLFSLSQDQVSRIVANTIRQRIRKQNVSGILKNTILKTDPMSSSGTLSSERQVIYPQSSTLRPPFGMAYAQSGPIASGVPRNLQRVSSLSHNSHLASDVPEHPSLASDIPQHPSLASDISKHPPLASDITKHPPLASNTPQNTQIPSFIPQHPQPLQTALPSVSLKREHPMDNQVVSISDSEDSILSDTLLKEYFSPQPALTSIPSFQAVHHPVVNNEEHPDYISSDTDSDLEMLDAIYSTKPKVPSRNPDVSIVTIDDSSSDSCIDIL